MQDRAEVTESYFGGGGRLFRAGCSVFRPPPRQNPAMATVLLLALPLAWRAGAPPTPCARSASALRGGHPAAAVAAVPQVLVQRFMPMMPCAA